MRYYLFSTSRSGPLSVCIAVLVFALTAPTYGQTTSRQAYAAIDPVKVQSLRPATATARTGDDVEVRIRSLHDRLQITPAEEAQWREVSRLMRINERQVREALVRREHTYKSTAANYLKSAAVVANVRTQAIARLIPAFQSLYDSMPDAQKKRADVIFGQTRQRS